MSGNSELSKWFPRDAPPTEEVRSPTPTKHKPTQIKKKGEKWTRDYLLSMFGIKTWKRSDAPIETPSGPMPVKGGIDFYGSVPLAEIPYNAHLEMEVKAFTESFQLSNIKPHQVELLNEAANRGDVAILSLVHVDNKMVQTMWWIPWPKGYPDNPEQTFMYPDGSGYPITHTFAWFMNELRGRKKGNFKAKGIRPQDHDLLEEWAVRKEGRIWKATQHHWLGQLTGNFSKVMESRLL